MSKEFSGSKETVYQFWEEIDPFGSYFVNLRYPVDIFNYIVYCLPFVIFVATCVFINIPIVLHCLHWFPKLLWPKLLGFPILHELLRRLTQIANPQPGSFGDLIKYFEKLYNITSPTIPDVNQTQVFHQ